MVWDQRSQVGASCQEVVGINTKGLFLRVEMGKDRVSNGPFSLSDGVEWASQGLYNTPLGGPGDAIIPPVGPGAGGYRVGVGVNRAGHPKSNKLNPSAADHRRPQAN